MAGALLGAGAKALGEPSTASPSAATSSTSAYSVQAALPPLEAMRPYQRDVVGMVLACWGLPLPAGGPLGALRSFPWLPAGAQWLDTKRYRDGLGKGWRGNWLVVAPTNSGKTRVFIEVARGVVEAARSRQGQQQLSSGGGGGAVVVVLVPTVPLTLQHAAYLERADLPHTTIRAVNSDSPLRAGEWGGLLQDARGPAGRSCVLVCTAAAFVNVLEREGGGGGAGGAQGAGVVEPAVDLLVLDEAHHCHSDHPYAAVVARLPAAAAVLDGGGGPRILGLTASPASNTSASGLEAEIGLMLARLGARLHVLEPEEDPSLAAVAPAPREAEMLVAARREDMRLASELQEFALVVAQSVAEDLLYESRGAGRSGADGDLEAAVVRQEDTHPTLQELRAFASTAAAPPAATAAAAVPPPPPEDGSWWARGAAAVAAGVMSTARTVVGSVELTWPQANGLDDLSVKPSYWLARLLAHDSLGGGPLAGFLGGGSGSSQGDLAVRRCFAVGPVRAPVCRVTRPPLTTPHRTEAFLLLLLLLLPLLLMVLLLMMMVMRYGTEHEEFHGVVFVRTRQAVTHLADAMRHAPQLQGTETLEAALASWAQAGLPGSGGEAVSPSTRVSDLLQWNALARDLAVARGLPRLHLTCRLISLLCKAAELAEDVGYEGVLPYLARNAAALCRQELLAEGGEGQAYFAEAGGAGSPALAAAVVAGQEDTHPTLQELRAFASTAAAPPAATAAAAVPPPPPEDGSWWARGAAAVAAGVMSTARTVVGSVELTWPQANGGGE
ncbi:Endoribonuclease Dicer 3b [Tetrabaena socialis]|uniref:Endoribonuclease Dicer 3b n=1 Tax=Tetrabaena socialis TaxID=47790 RepID=A0A2J8AFQ2_9CHLO|nr:Endoribonuclease Dicer 3b [Tetrabaena socialis]|eukprot:PNH11348.1 Endoribonuclease Dicer 3b [Tetrabaena socialis]